jgi:hypothetical protein
VRRILTRSADDFSIKTATDCSWGEGSINTLNARWSWDNGMHRDGNGVLYLLIITKLWLFGTGW